MHEEQDMFTRNIRRASRLTLAFGGLVITATVSAADVQSQAQEVMIGRPPTSVEFSEATPSISRLTGRPRIDVQQQASHLLSGLSQEISKGPTTQLTLRTPRSLQSANARQFSSSQEMAQKLVLGIVGE
jgi:hypothetical protein